MVQVPVQRLARASIAAWRQSRCGLRPEVRRTDTTQRARNAELARERRALSRAAPGVEGSDSFGGRGIERGHFAFCVVPLPPMEVAMKDGV